MADDFVTLVEPFPGKYERLVEAHDKLQKLNNRLEEKLLKLAEDQHLGTIQLTQQTQSLTQRLVEARLYIHQLEEENERYRNDINVVVQLLHCKPSNFISSKITSLPDDLQRKVLGEKNMASGRNEKKIIKVQVPTLPHTDIMYSVDKCRPGKQHAEKDMVSAAIMAKILQEREREREENLKNRCQCASRIILPTTDKETQTLPSCTISCVDFSLPEEVSHPDREADEKFASGPGTGMGDTNYESTSAHQSSSSSLSSHSPTWIRRPDSLNFSQTRKMAGHCVRVLDEKDRGTDAHWSTTVLVQHPPKTLSFPRPAPPEGHAFFEQKSPDTETDDPLSIYAPRMYSSPQPQQYYRAQKRSFWTRSSSTTSTETEI